MNTKKIYTELFNVYLNVDTLKERADELGIYPRSIQEKEDSILFLSHDSDGKHMIIIHKGPVYDAFEGEEVVKEGVKNAR